MSSDDLIRQQAALWAAQTRDPDFDDWPGFTKWLEQSPAHNDAYSAVTLATDEAVELALALEAQSDPAPEAANDDAAGRRPLLRRRWFGGALAASLAGLLALTLSPTSAGVARYQTEPGEILAIELEGGASIELGGGSEIVLSGEGQRIANLVDGQALFTVEPGDQGFVRVVAGPDTIIDIGTVFDVRLSKGMLQVEVAEGAVVVNPDARNLQLEAGQALSKVGDAYEVSEIATVEVGEWREGRVNFRSARLDEVADRLSRATGIVFTAESASDARFSGSVVVDQIKADPATIGALLDIEVDQIETGWALSPG